MPIYIPLWSAYSIHFYDKYKLQSMYQHIIKYILLYYTISGGFRGGGCLGMGAETSTVLLIFIKNY